ncbi:DUF222 domain-containing protein [Microbispora sp. NPDC046973]|uniref:HNH endonuclease signature motif containing protein n=1 Tax=Microbispora sp. NPDC046973 TaxID=3155022 RepID=UPI0033D0762D
MDLFDSDSEHLRRSNSSDSADGWWDRLASGSPLWSSEGSAVREHFPINDPEVPQDAGQDTGDGVPGAARGKGRSSWVLVGGLRESAQALALTPLPEDVDVCLAEAEELMFVRDRITCALADRVGRVHGAGRAKEHGHASTRSWLRSAGGMTVAGAGRLLTLAVELARLPRVRERFAAGKLAAGVVEAICMATAQLNDEQAALAEPILLELAGKAGAAEVAKAGRYLRAVLDPDGEDRDEQADYARRFLRVRPTRSGGLEGEFCLPREAAARLRALLDAYAKPRAEGDDRPPSVRNADAFIALLEEKIATELLVLVTAESLPTDPEDAAHSHPARPDAADHPEAAEAGHPDHPDQPDQPDQPEAAEPGEAGSADAPAEADDTGDRAPSTHARSGSGSTDAPGEGDDTGDRAPSACAPRDAGGADEVADADAAAPAEDEGPCRLADFSTAGADAGAAAGAVVDSAAVAKDGDTVEGDDIGRAKGGDCDRGAAHVGATHPRRAAAWPACGGSAHSPTAPPRTAPPSTVPPHTASPATAPLPTAQPDPPPEDAAAHHAHAGYRPAGDCRHGQGTSEDQAGVRGEQCQGPGLWLGTAPGLLLATGQMLPVSSVHRLARTSTLVRLVMDADGQVLDMGRKVRLATPAQRRAVFARYATCWIDGCPLPATMCQIDHADNWSTGGLTDLNLLGPACQFHNRDRYRHPDRYTRRTVGTDRWAFTYHPARTRARRLRE